MALEWLEQSKASRAEVLSLVESLEKRLQDLSNGGKNKETLVKYFKEEYFIIKETSRKRRYFYFRITKDV